jgi:succinate-acetate transporter protein
MLSKEEAVNQISNLDFPIVNIRRTSNLAITPLNYYAIATSIFMYSARLMGWIELQPTSLMCGLIFGGIILYILGIYDWYSGLSYMSFIDFMFSFFNILIWLNVKLHKYLPDLRTDKDGSTVNGIFYFRTNMQGVFYILMVVTFLVLIVAGFNQGMGNLIGLVIFVIGMILYLSYHFCGDYGQKALKKVTGYFFFVGSIVFWFVGTGRFINEVFGEQLIPLVEPTANE